MCPAKETAAQAYLNLLVSAVTGLCTHKDISLMHCLSVIHLYDDQRQTSHCACGSSFQRVQRFTANAARSWELDERICTDLAAAERLPALFIGLFSFCPCVSKGSRAATP